MSNIPNRSLSSSRADHLDDHNELAAFHNLIDAKGDLIVGTAADTAGRLAAGAVKQRLTVQADLSLAWEAVAAVDVSYAGSTDLAATTVEAALDELDAEKAPRNIPVFAAAPGSPVNGQQYIDSVLLTLRVYYGGAWKTVASVA